MRGVVFTGSEAEVVDDLVLRPTGPRELRVSIRAAGICHTDLSVIDGTIPMPTPIVLGHEGAGVVIEVGDQVRSVAVGDHVVLTTLAPCGQCGACEHGWPTRCRATLGGGGQPFTRRGQQIYSFSSTSVFSDEVVVSESQAVVIDPQIPLTSASLVGCAVVTGAGSVWNRANVQRGQSAAVFGIGGVGLSVIQGLRIAGASRIIAIDNVTGKEEIARQVGATDFFEASRPDLIDAVRGLEPYGPGALSGIMNAGGVDWVFDCVGNAAIVSAGLEMLEWGGSVVIIGVPGPGTEFSASFSRLIHVDRSVMGCRYGQIRPHHDIPLILDLYKRGEFFLDELVTQTFAIDDYPAAIERVLLGDAARVVLTF